MTTPRRLLVPPDADADYAALVAAVQSGLPDWAADDSDPLAVALRSVVAQKLALIGRFNASADQSLVSTAAGEALEELVAPVGLTRQPGETDTQLRQRYADQFRSRSVGTPESVRADAAAASPLVADATFRPDRAANRIDVWITARPPAGSADIAPDAALRTLVQDYLNADARRLLWIDYRVNAPTVTAYTVTGAVVYARGSPSPEAPARANLARVMTALRTLDTRVSTGVLTAALAGAGVTADWTADIVDVDLTAPAADLPAAVDTAYVGAIGTLTFTEAS